MSKTILFQKHKENRKAGELLMLDDHKYYASSVHCYYYSIYQLTEFILSDVLNLSESDLKALSKLYLAKGGKQRNSHEVTIMVLFQQLSSLFGSEIANYYKNRMLELKTFRVKADYLNDSINLGVSRQSNVLCTRIIESLYTQFNLS